jgi:hypothetical protein
VDGDGFQIWRVAAIIANDPSATYEMSQTISDLDELFETKKNQHGKRIPATGRGGQ